MDRHHNAPPIEDRLALDHAELIVRANNAIALVPDVLRPIHDDEEADAYTDTAGTILDVLADADAAFKPAKEPWLTGGRKVEDFFAFRKILKAKADAAKAAINVYQNAKLAAQRKADAEAAEQARKEAALFDEPAPVVAPTVVREAARIVTMTGTKATASIKWEHRVVDLDKVPRQFLMVNDAAIKAAIAGGKREIEGVEIFEAVKTAIRR